MDNAYENQQNATPNDPAHKRRQAQTDLEELKRVLAVHTNTSEKPTGHIQKVELPAEEDDLPMDTVEEIDLSAEDWDGEANWEPEDAPEPEPNTDAPKDVATESSDTADAEQPAQPKRPRSRPQPKTEEERQAEIEEIERRRQQLRQQRQQRQEALEQRQREQILERQAKRRQQELQAAAAQAAQTPPPKTAKAPSAAQPTGASPSGASQTNKIKKPAHKKTAPAGAARAAGTAKAVGAAHAAAAAQSAHSAKPAAAKPAAAKPSAAKPAAPAPKKIKSKAAIYRRNLRLIRIGGLIAALLVIAVVLVSAIRGIGSWREEQQAEPTTQQQPVVDTSLPASQQESEQYQKIKDDTSLPAYAKAYPGMYANAVSEPNRESESKVCYLTFDDGPSANYTPNILDVLKEKNVKATFFVIASEIDGNEDLIKRIVDEGHTLSIYCNRYEYSSLYESVDSYLQDFCTAYDKIYELTGYRVQGFRFPGGSNNSVIRRSDTYDDIVSEMTRRGFEYYDWNAYAHDAESVNYTVDQIVDFAVNEVVKNSRNDVILLMHDRQKTANGLLSIIEQLQEEEIDMKAITNTTRPVHFNVSDSTPDEMPGA